MDSDEDDLWHSFEVIILAGLPPDLFSNLFVNALESRRKTPVDESVIDRFGQHANVTDPTPLYVEAVDENVEADNVAFENVQALPENAKEIWTEQYQNLLEVNAPERRVLLTAALLARILPRTPLHRSLLRAVCAALFDIDRLDLANHLERFVDDRWFRATNTREGATRYVLHDVKVAAILETSPVAESDTELYYQELSDFLLETDREYLPDNSGDVGITIHYRLAEHFSSRVTERETRHLEWVLEETGAQLATDIIIMQIML